jgi:hypothetical protein
MILDGDRDGGTGAGQTGDVHGGDPSVDVNEIGPGFLDRSNHPFNPATPPRRPGTRAAHRARTETNAVVHDPVVVPRRQDHGDIEPLRDER